MHSMHVCVLIRLYVCHLRVHGDAKATLYNPKLYLCRQHLSFANMTNEKHKREGERGQKAREWETELNTVECVCPLFAR